MAGFSVYAGFKSLSASGREFRFLVNNMLFQLDSESIFEMLEDFPEFVLGTSIRGEGKMAAPVLFHLLRLRDTRGLGREQLKDHIKRRLGLGRRAADDAGKGAAEAEGGAARGSPAPRKPGGAALKGSLKFVMDYVERYKQVKHLEEDGLKGLSKMQALLERDSLRVVAGRGGRFFLANEMERLEQSLLGKRAPEADARRGGEAAEDAVAAEMPEARGFALYGSKFAFRAEQSKDERSLDLRLQKDLETRRVKAQRRAAEKRAKIQRAREALARRRRVSRGESGLN